MSSVTPPLTPIATILLLALAALQSTPARAGDLTAYSCAIKSTSSNKCALLCTDSVKVNSVISAQATITPGEISSFTAATVLTFQPIFVSANDTFTLGDAPDYQPGGTQATFVEAYTSLGGPVTITTAFTWGDGIIRVQRTAKGKGSTSYSHPNNTTSHLPKVDALIKDHQADPTTMPFLLQATNGSSPVYTTEAILQPKAKGVETILINGPNDEVGRTYQATIKIKDFLPPSAVP